MKGRSGRLCVGLLLTLAATACASAGPIGPPSVVEGRGGESVEGVFGMPGPSDLTRPPSGSGLIGAVAVEPVCANATPSCARVPDPVPATVTAADLGSGHTIGNGHTGGREARFAIALPTGRYRVTATPDASGLECPDQVVTVSSVTTYTGIFVECRAN